MLRVKTTADPATVYDVLQDLHSHLQWNGEEQAANFCILSLDAPAGRAQVGTRFSSTGSIPFSGRKWQDESVVTVADGHRFEFRTNGFVDYGGGSGMRAVFFHRYELEAMSGGSLITYTMRLESMTNGMWRISWPILRDLTWRFGIPMATKPGLRNLARLAERRAASKTAVPGS